MVIHPSLYYSQWVVGGEATSCMYSSLVAGYYVAVGQVNDDNEYRYCITGGLGRAGATRHGTVGSRPFLKHYNLLIITYYRYCFFLLGGSWD